MKTLVLSGLGLWVIDCIISFQQWINPQFLKIDTWLLNFFFIGLQFKCSFSKFMLQKYSKKTLFFQVFGALQTFVKPLVWFIVCYCFVLQHLILLIYRSPTCSSRHVASPIAPSAHNTPWASPLFPPPVLARNEAIQRGNLILFHDPFTTLSE